MLASAVLGKAKKILNDDNVAYLDTEILGWLNDGRVQIVKDRKDAYTIRETVKLSEGTAQTLEPDCIALIDITRNMGADGSTPGSAITMMDKDSLDRWRPTWHSEDANATVKHFVINPLTPREFFAYPAQPSTAGYVERIVAKAPAAVAEGDDIILSDEWVNALVQFICWMAHSKDADTSDASKGAQHRANYVALVGA